MRNHTTHAMKEWQPLQKNLYTFKVKKLFFINRPTRIIFFCIKTKFSGAANFEDVLKLFKRSKLLSGKFLKGNWSTIKSVTLKKSDNTWSMKLKKTICTIILKLPQTNDYVNEERITHRLAQLEQQTFFALLAGSIRPGWPALRQFWLLDWFLVRVRSRPSIFKNKFLVQNGD